MKILLLCEILIILICYLSFTKKDTAVILILLKEVNYFGAPSRLAYIFRLYVCMQLSLCHKFKYFNPFIFFYMMT